MVKIGSHVGAKPEVGQPGEEGLDCSPLLMPLDVSQLQQPVPDKVVVKTTAEYQLQQKKKKKTCVPGIKKLNINLYDEVSEKVKHKHCTPEPLEAYYPQPESGPRGRLYAAISHLSQAEKTVPKLLPSSWLPVISALKGARKNKLESGHAHQKGSSDPARHQRD